MRAGRTALVVVAMCTFGSSGPDHPIGPSATAAADGPPASSGRTGELTASDQGRAAGGACCLGAFDCADVPDAATCDGLGGGTVCGIFFPVEALTTTTHFDTCSSSYNTVLDIFDIRGGTALASNDDCADTDAVADPMGGWVRPLMDAMRAGKTVLQAMKTASRDSQDSPINQPGRTQDRAVYRTGGPGGAGDITLADPEAASHHAVFIAGTTDQLGIENEIKRMCELLEEQWGDLNTTGTSVHLLYGIGTRNPCAGSGVPNDHVMAATFANVCRVLEDLATNGLGPNEEFVLFLGDHGLGTERAVNKSAPATARAPIVAHEVVLDLPLVHGMRRDPRNAPFLRIVATGPYPPETVAVFVNGLHFGHLNPAAVNEAGQNETLVFVPDSAFAVGPNAIDVDLAGTAASLVEIEFFTGAVAPVPAPGWGDANGDGEVDLLDLPDFAACLSGPGGGYNAPACFDLDIDRDGDVDLDDYRLFQLVFTSGL